jgi:cell fate regulator YaaT (PSP1 superfamily)
MNNSCIARGCKDIKADQTDSPACKPCSCNKLDVYDWLGDVPSSSVASNIVEVRFKNSRKGFYRNVNDLSLKPGDIVAVEASPGHDIGIVSLAGELVKEQLREQKLSETDTEFRKVYRKAKQADVEKWIEALNMEDKTMLRSRKIASQLNLNMKIGDVEYQGDKTKAIFYYIAEERVDFRELIKVLAEEFRVRIEMRQIGARQEAGRIGGIASCGRELCCSTWITNFVSVTTNAARYQEVSLNPQKLAGQCGKLKCCLNFELDVYLDAQKDMPEAVSLETVDGTAYYIKTDVFRGVMWYSFDKDSALNMIPVSVERVREIINLNKHNKKVKELIEVDKEAKPEPGYQNVVGQDSLTRFQENRKPKNKNRNNRNRNRDKDNRENKESKETREQPRENKGERPQLTPRKPNQNQNPNNTK